MYIINLLLRIASLLVLLLLIHQLFFSKGIIRRHRILGKVTMVVGTLIVVLVTIRGWYHKETFSVFYTLHLMLGVLFFFLLFRTGYLGYRSQRDLEFASPHRKYAKATLLFLILTLVIGVISFLSH